MILGNVEGENAVAEEICEQVGAVVVSVEYRLAPEDPHPAPAEDCYAGLVWMARNAAELGFDPQRLAVYGGSAGGGLTIAVVLLARDRGFPAIRFQMPIYPMIDDTNETPSSQRDHRHRRLGPGGQHRGLGLVPRRRQAGLVRRPGARRGPVRAAADLHRRGHLRHVPRRGHRVRDAPHAGGRADRAARQPGRLPRVGGSSPRRPRCRSASGSAASTPCAAPWPDRRPRRAGRPHRVVCAPPLTWITCPVMCRAPGDARKYAVCAISSGRPARPSWVAAISAARRCSVSLPWKKPVSSM